MSLPLLRSALRLGALIGATSLASSASAQVILSGALSDATTGPLLSNTVYQVNGNIVVPAGATLTVQAGAIVKFNFDRLFTIDGTLLVAGLPNQPVHFTDLRDDSIGGDTNGDGNATSPAPGWWRGLVFSGTADGSIVRDARVRFGGRFVSGLELDACDATFIDVTVSDFSTHAVDLGDNSRPTLDGVEALNCQGVAFSRVPIQAAAGFSRLSASGNQADWIDLTATTIAAGEDVLVPASGGLLGAYRVGTSIGVAAGGRLELGPGAILKFGFDRSLRCDGELRVAGTPGQPVYLTDERDDTVGGDSNSDGNATQGLAGWWRGVELDVFSDASLLENVELRFGGRFVSALELTESDATVRNARIRDFTSDGVDLNIDSRPTLEDVDVQRCAGDAFDGVALQALPGFVRPTASNNNRNWINVTSATLAAGEAVTIAPINGVNGVVRAFSNIVVEPGASLTLEAGTVLKFAFDRGLRASGVLQANGTSASPVAFVDERDDRGGDSNGDGAASAPLAGWWRGIELLDTADGSSLTHAEVRHGGRFVALLDVTNATMSATRCLFAESSTQGIDLNGSDEPHALVQCEVRDCGGEAVDGVRVDRLSDLLGLRSSGNGANRIRVTQGTVQGDATVGPQNQTNGFIFVDTIVHVPAGASLTLLPGVALQMAFDRRIDVDGMLAARGSFERPVVVTSAADETVVTGAGPGASPGSVGDWRGIDLRSTTAVSPLLGLEVRNGGRFIPGIIVRTPNAALREVRVQRSAIDGIRFEAAPIVAERLALWANSGDGVELAGGTFDVRQVTAVGNGGVGVRATGAWSGSLADSISRGNGNGAYAGFMPGQVRYSNGDPALAGTAGNVDVDPLFLDAAAGDLRIPAGSPAVDAGDPSSPLDPDSTRADQGAYWFNTCAPEVFCAQAPVGPCAPTLSFNGFASLTSPAPFDLRLDDAPTQSFAILFYGLGARASVPGAFGTICVGGPYQRTMPVASGGDPANGPCDGTFEFDWNAYLGSGADPAIVAGSNVIAHFWYRDGNAPGNARFSAAIEMPTCP